MTAHIHLQAKEDALALRHTFGAFPTGVTVITTMDSKGNRIGLTCNSFASVSLAPPLISWSVIKSSKRAPHYIDCDHFAVSILASDQEGVARVFAKSAADGFNSVAHYPAASNCPQIAGAAAVLDCKLYGRYELGDHIMFVGYVLSHSSYEKRPLTFYRGQFGSLPVATVHE